MTFCDDPNYHGHRCPGYSLATIADSMDRLLEIYENSLKMAAQIMEDRLSADQIDAKAQAERLTEQLRGLTR